jgi:hypothetical protein
MSLNIALGSWDALRGQQVEPQAAASGSVAGTPTLNQTAAAVNRSRKKVLKESRRDARARMARGDPPPPSGASMPPLPQSQQQQVALAFGAFERHTLGVGLRIMERMGFVVGQGLGPAGAGIPQPIMAMQRARRQGLGA